MPLYRALRDVEVAGGNVLIPKSQGPFRAHPRLPINLPFSFGEREEHAVREHQLDGQYPTRGVSCTTDWKVALRYAARTKVIVRIDEGACKRHGIRRFCVREHVPVNLILHAEDEEVILVSEVDGTFPKDTVAEVFKIEENGVANTQRNVDDL